MAATGAAVVTGMFLDLPHQVIVVDRDDHRWQRLHGRLIVTTHPPDSAAAG